MLKINNVTMEEKIEKILLGFHKKEYSLNEAKNKLLDLFPVIVSEKDCRIPMRKFGSDKCLICGKKTYEH